MSYLLPPDAAIEKALDRYRDKGFSEDGREELRAWIVNALKLEVDRYIGSSHEMGS